MAGNLERTIADLRAERDNVERLLRTQQELVASVSHELRTPVATMHGYLESALNGDRERSPAEFHCDLEIMSGEIVRLQRLIDDLFILSRIETGKLPLDIQPTEVPPIVSRSVVAVAESAWRTGRVEVIENISAGLPAALADAGRLEQVLRNLLSNAIRHTPPGGIVAVSAGLADDMLFIDVQDTGQGIDPKNLQSIFERFYRLDDARKRDPTGAGLGLAIVKELTEAMGGQVSVESEPGSGSRFRIMLLKASQRESRAATGPVHLDASDNLSG
jgi:signal transduction histidine kinase